MSPYSTSMKKLPEGQRVVGNRRNVRQVRCHGEASVDAALSSGARGPRPGADLCGIAPASPSAGEPRGVSRETGGVEAHDVALLAKVIQIDLIGTFTMVAKCAAGMLRLQPGRRRLASVA